MSDIAVQSHIAHRTSHIAHRTSPELLPSSGRIQEIDALRGFAIFLVVLHHSVLRFPIDMLENTYCRALVRWCVSVHMPLFFMIAGFCWSCLDYKTYLRKKFLRLIVPYVVFNLIDMLPRYLLASLVRRPKPISESIINMLLYGGEFWFLFALFGVLVIYPLIDRLTASDKLRMSIIACVLFAVSSYGVKIKIFLVGEIAYYLFFFHAGVMARVLTGGKLTRLKAPLLVMLVMLALWLLLLWRTEHLRVVTALAGITACFLMTSFSVFNNMFARFGGYSLQLYLLNGITLGISRAVICNVLHVDNYAVIIAFNMVIDFLASYMLIKYVLSKNRLIRFLMGIV